MFGKKNLRKIIITLLALTLVLGTVALAADSIYTKQLKATYGRIKFNYEGTDVTSQIENKYGTPAFVVEDRAYAPVRAIADLLGVEIEYDHDTHTAEITDTKVKDYKLELAEKNVEIANLKADITKLEKKLKEEDKKEEDKKEEINKSDLSSLEKTLNNKYSVYNDLDFDVVLKESTSNKITVTINTDLARTSDEQSWIRMKSSDKKSMIEDIVKQVRDEFKSATISGSIYDKSSRKDLYTFSVDSRGTLTMSDRGYYDDRYYDDRYYDDRYYDGTLDSYVDWELYKAHGIRGARLYESSSYRDTYQIYIDDTSDNTTKWKDAQDDIKATLEKISKEIEYEYKLPRDSYMYIDVIKGRDTLGTYKRDLRYSSGDYTEAKN